jgi:hypothetical protein
MQRRGISRQRSEVVVRSETTGASYQESPVRLKKAVRRAGISHSKSTAKLSKSFEDQPKQLLRSRSQVRSSVSYTRKTPLRSTPKTIRRTGSYVATQGINASFIQGDRPIFSNKSMQVQCDCDTAVRVLPGSTWHTSNGPRVRQTYQKLPHEAELFDILESLTARTFLDVKSVLPNSPQATAIGLSMLMLFADVDRTIEVVCQHRYIKGRDLAQVSEYFSTPGNAISVCRRFIPNVKKGRISLNAVQQASDQLGQVKLLGDSEPGVELLYNFTATALNFFEAWQQYSRAL